MLISISPTRQRGHQRPWFKGLTARLHGGYLREGDTIIIVFGDTAAGSPGMQMQTFVESGFEFKVLADVCAVGHYVPLPETPAVAIVPGPPKSWKAVLPTLRRPGESFQLGLKAEGLMGNPTDLASAQLRLQPSAPVENLPEHIDYLHGTRSMCLENLLVAEPTCLWIDVWLDDEQICRARSFAHPRR